MAKPADRLQSEGSPSAPEVRLLPDRTANNGLSCQHLGEGSRSRIRLDNRESRCGHACPASRQGRKLRSNEGCAWIATCTSDDPDFGWMVEIIVKSRDAADQIVSAWKPQVERCDLVAIGA